MAVVIFPIPGDGAIRSVELGTLDFGICRARNPGWRAFVRQASCLLRDLAGRMPAPRGESIRATRYDPVVGKRSSLESVIGPRPPHKYGSSLGLRPIRWQMTAP